MLAGIVAGRAAGALWGQVFVVPRMHTAGSGSYLAVDLSAGRFAVCGLVAALTMLLSFGRRPKPTVRQARAALGISVLGFTGY